MPKKIIAAKATFISFVDIRANQAEYAVIKSQNAQNTVGDDQLIVETARNNILMDILGLLNDLKTELKTTMKTWVNMVGSMSRNIVRN